MNMTQAIKILKIAVAILTVVSTLAGQPQTPFPVVSDCRSAGDCGPPGSTRLPGKTVTLAHCGRYRLFLLVSLPHPVDHLVDQYNRQRLPYFYCCFDFDRTTFEMFPDPHWVNSTGYLRAMLQGFIERLYPYTGDARTLIFLQDFVDYELENGRTPEGYAWAQVPYASANPGAKRYTGWSAHGEDYIEPPVVGEDGYAYLRLYEMTGNTKYLRAAIRCANALVKNYKAGMRKLALAGALLCTRRKSRRRPMGPYSAT